MPRITALHMLRSTMTTVSAPAVSSFRGSKSKDCSAYARRNFLVPIPVFESFEALNAHLLDCCRRLGDRLRGHGEKISERLERDLAAAASIDLAVIAFSCRVVEELVDELGGGGDFSDAKAQPGPHAVAIRSSVTRDFREWAHSAGIRIAAETGLDAWGGRTRNIVYRFQNLRLKCRDNIRRQR